MDPRGAAPTAICPRCGAEAPPSYDRIVICARCNLGFSPAGDLVVAPRREALVPEQPTATRRLVTTQRTTAGTKIRIAGRGWLAYVPFVLGVAGVLLAVAVDHPVLRLIQVGLGFALGAFGMSAIDAQAVLVDRYWIETRRIPLTVWRHRLPHADCVVVEASGTQVRALTRDGRVHLVLAAPDPDTAERVAFEVRAAMNAHPYHDVS